MGTEPSQGIIESGHGIPMSMTATEGWINAVEILARFSGPAGGDTK